MNTLRIITKTNANFHDLVANISPIVAACGHGAGSPNPHQGFVDFEMLSGGMPFRETEKRITRYFPNIGLTIIEVEK